MVFISMILGISFMTINYLHVLLRLQFFVAAIILQLRNFYLLEVDLILLVVVVVEAVVG